MCGDCHWQSISIGAEVLGMDPIRIAVFRHQGGLGAADAAILRNPALRGKNCAGSFNYPATTVAAEFPAMMPIAPQSTRGVDISASAVVTPLQAPCLFLDVGSSPARSVARSQFSVLSIPWRTTTSGSHHGASAPSARHVQRPQGETGSTCLWLHLPKN